MRRNGTRRGERPFGQLPFAGPTTAGAASLEPNARTPEGEPGRMDGRRSFVAAAAVRKEEEEEGGEASHLVE